jgi:peptidoglycan/xylan/chitin deacetylase (PgdA/CDA1 family)
MRLIEAGRLNRILRRVTAPLRCSVVILMYHRVFETSSDPWQLGVSPKHFAEHLKILQKNYRILSLHDLLSSLKNARLPKRGVVLTFDDGYADNFWNAKPLLEKYEVPATVFISSGNLDSHGEFWWDNLERALLKPKKLPKCLQLQVQGRTHEWPTLNLNQRQHALIAIHQILQPLIASDRDKVMAEIFGWADVDKMGRPDYRPLTTTELIQLAKSELIDIGSHTLTHPLLSAMSEADQFAEISGSREKLEDIIGRRVDTFSYPYGNFSAETVGIAAKAGFVAALTTESNAVKLGVNPLLLGRFGVGNWAAGTFRQRLDYFFRT